MKLKVSVNKNCLNKQNPQLLAKGWKNVYVDMDWLLGWVANGYGWCATHFADRHRKADSATGSNMIVIDFDGDTTVRAFWATDTAQQWCAATYTSASHTKNEHRFRAIFPLEKELNSSAEHRGAYWLIVNRLLAELKLESLNDNCGQKPERLWYGNTNAITEHRPGNCVPAFLLEDIAYEEATDFAKADLSPKDVERCQWLLGSFLEPSSDGEYESYFVPVMAACAGVGGDLWENWVEWVRRGHHGNKPENTRPSKWKGLGHHAGHTTLYKLAKKQNADWTKHLPVHLSFSQTGAAAGYSEVDPVIDIDAVLDKSKLMNQPSNIVDFPEPVPDSSEAPKKRGRPKKNSSDAAADRENDVKQVQEMLRGLRKNELTNTIEYTNSTGQEVLMQGNDLDLMTTKFACEYGIFIPETRMRSAIQYAAGKNTYCPIRKYLDNCAATATPHPDWERVGEVFLGNTHNVATVAMQRLMIGAVARAYNPGCTMSWLPILVGHQGAGKSQFSRSLVPDALFAEITAGIDQLSKEMYRLHTGWLLELPEIDQYFNARNIENFKNLVTTRCDEVRFPYASLPTKLNRRFVMIGTTNRNQFLVDSTGNRRFVPLEVAPKFEIPWKQLALERDSLWAAAIAAYRANDPYEFTSGEIAAMSEYIQQFGDPDPWAELITNYLATREECTAAELLTKALSLDHDRQSQRESRRAVEVLQSLGWRRKQTTRKDKITGKSKSVRLWVRPEEDPLDESHIMQDF